LAGQRRNYAGGQTKRQVRDELPAKKQGCDKFFWREK